MAFVIGQATDESQKALDQVTQELTPPEPATPKTGSSPTMAVAAIAFMAFALWVIGRGGPRPRGSKWVGKAAWE